MMFMEQGHFRYQSVQVDGRIQLGIIEIQRAFNRAQDKEDPDLRMVRLLPSDAEVLFKHLSLARHIRQLWLHECCLKGRGVIEISSLIKSAGQLTHLFLFDSKITSKGVVTVAAMLKRATYPK